MTCSICKYPDLLMQTAHLWGALYAIVGASLSEYSSPPHFHNTTLRASPSSIIALPKMVINNCSIWLASIIIVQPMQRFTLVAPYCEDQRLSKTKGETKYISKKKRNPERCILHIRVSNPILYHRVVSIREVCV